MWNISISDRSWIDMIFISIRSVCISPCSVLSSSGGGWNYPRWSRPAVVDATRRGEPTRWPVSSSGRYRDYAVVTRGSWEKAPTLGLRYLNVGRIWAPVAGSSRWRPDVSFPRCPNFSFFFRSSFFGTAAWVWVCVCAFVCLYSDWREFWDLKFGAGSCILLKWIQLHFDAIELKWINWLFCSSSPWPSSISPLPVIELNSI